MGRASFTVFSARFEGCIFKFQKGETYLVYAYDGPTHFGIDFPHVTNSCTRTKLSLPESEEVTQLPSPSWYRSSEKGAVTVLEIVEQPACTPGPVVLENQTVSSCSVRSPDEAAQWKRRLADLGVAGTTGWLLYHGYR
jgi:hypothetical protein